MKNIGKNSLQTNLLRHLFFFLLLFFLTFGIAYWHYTEPDRKLASEINWIKNNRNVEYDEDLSDDEIVQYNETNHWEEENLIKKLQNPDTNLSKKRRRKFRELLKEIIEKTKYIKEIDQEKLENTLEKERKEIIHKILEARNMLTNLKSIIEPKWNEAEKNNYLKVQNEWFSEYFPGGFKFDEKDEIWLQKGEKSQEDLKVTEEIKKFMDHFYEEYKKVYNLTSPKIVQPTRTINGDLITLETPQKEIEEKINQLKKKGYPYNFDNKMKVIWESFAGWHEKGEKDKGNVTVGLTHYTPSKELSEDETVKICQNRIISITLDAKFPFGRKGKRYESWSTKKPNGQLNNLRIDWNSLIETIAHELAHAIINTTKISYRDEDHKGGHGTLHSEYTKKMKKLIKESSKYQDFKNFWFKK